MFKPDNCAAWALVALDTEKVYPIVGWEESYVKISHVKQEMSLPEAVNGLHDEMVVTPVVLAADRLIGTPEAVGISGRYRIVPVMPDTYVEQFGDEWLFANQPDSAGE